MSSANFCNKCGKPTKTDSLEKDSANIEFFSISLGRLAFFSILTLGIYDIFWFAKNWSSIKKAERVDISPVSRAFFTIFYCYSLFKKILLSAKKHGYSNSYSPGILAIIYIILLLLGNGLSRIENVNPGLDILWLLIASCSFIPLLTVQKAINFNNSKIIPDFSLNRKFSTGEIILTAIGVIWFGLITLGVFSSLNHKNSELGLSPKTTEELIIDTVKELKTEITLPSKVDEVTELVGVTAEPEAIRYHMLLSNVDVSRLSNSGIKKSLLSSLCEDKDVRYTLSQNINLEYSYTVDTGDRFFVSITKTDCLQ